MSRMSLPFDPKRIRAYEFEFGAGGNRLGCNLRLDDGSLLFIHDSACWAGVTAAYQFGGVPLSPGCPNSEDAGADYVEPISQVCGTKCVHADWRNHLYNIYSQ